MQIHLCAAQARLLNAFTSQPTYNDAAANADFALVTLAQPVGDTAGWMGFEYPADGAQTVDLTTAGEHSQICKTCSIILQSTGSTLNVGHVPHTCRLR